MIISLFLLGLSFGAGPCLMSCGPVLLPYLTQAGDPPLRSLRKYFLFCLGRLLVYAGLGLAIYFLGKLATDELLGRIGRYAYLFGGIFIIVLGLTCIIGKQRKSPLCAFIERQKPGFEQNNIFLMGLIMGLLPCGPVMALLAAIALVSKHWMTSLFYSLVFGAGTMISPLMLFSVFASSASLYIKKKGLVWQKLLNYLCGGIMIFLGIQFLLKAKG
jgi:sulfite exporter TauE/SafE